MLERVFVLFAVLGLAGCQASTVLERSTEAQQRSSNLLVQFAKAADLSSRAVMAGTSEASAALARETDQATEGIQSDTDALAALLQSLGYGGEIELLKEFGGRFAEYRTLDREILALAVEGTNVKAQRLSFGAAMDAADACQDALEALVPASPATRDRVSVPVATAVAGIREIQALQAPHIAEADDAAMTKLEAKMTASESAARRALASLEKLTPAASRATLTEATASFDRFMAVHSEIITLSRRNSNVRSLALSMNQKRTLAAACEDSLRALQEALSKRNFPGTR